MDTLREVLVPDIGDFADVPVTEILVAVGDSVAIEDPLVAIESDKATMEIPAPFPGVVREILLSVGDKVSEGTPILRLEGGEESGPPALEPSEGSRAAADDAQGEEHIILQHSDKCVGFFYSLLYSVRRFSTGFARPACRLRDKTVPSANSSKPSPAAAKIHQDNSVR